MSDAMQAETIEITGSDGTAIPSYFARPLGDGPYPGVVVIHHMPGWDRATKEIVRTFGVRGYATICPSLHDRYAPGARASDAAAAARAAGGVPDNECIGVVGAAATFLRAQPNSNGQVGVIGYCSGGRQTVLVAAHLDLNAAVDCYGGGADPAWAADLHCPLLGLFGNEDQRPSPDNVVELDKALTTAGKDHEFHSYDGAGHAFFSVDRPNYNLDAARDGWKRIWDFFGRHLSDTGKPEWPSERPSERKEA